MTAQWLDLLMLNVAVDPQLLTPYIPAGTELDLWKGEALVSVIGFRFVDTRLLGVPVPWHRDFEEVNLQFYVLRGGPEGDRRAVVFIRELVPRRAIAWVARAYYNEPYRAVHMRHSVTTDDGMRTVRHAWQEGRVWTGLAAHTVGAASALVPGSEVEFITEHYWGYTRQRDGGTAFAPWLAAPPRSAFVAEGSGITVFRPRRLSLEEHAARQG